MNAHQLPFETFLTPIWNPLAYDIEERKIVINNLQNRSKYYDELLEKDIVFLLSHETVHGVLHDLIDLDTSRDLDKVEHYHSKEFISDPRGLS